MSEQENESELTESNQPRLLVRLIGIGLILVAIIIAIYLIVGYFAYQSGQTLRVENEQLARATQLDRQVDLASDDIAAGSYNLALRRLEWVLERDQTNEAALALQRQVQAALKTTLTPDVLPTPTVQREPTATPGAIVDPEDVMQRMRRLSERGQWEELLPVVLAFQRQYPSYQRLQTDQFLYAAYLNLGLDYVQGERIEEGLYYFAQAEKLGDLPQEALDYWLWAELYLQGLAYFGVNWGVASSNLRDLCLAAPFYQGVCDKLFEALTAYGDQYAFAQDWCPAEPLFREARQYGSSAELNAKINAAVEGCAAATPTPAAPITGTLTLTQTVPLITPTVDE